MGVALLLALATPAAAERGYVLIAGGLSFPQGDDEWTASMDLSPVAAVRGGLSAPIPEGFVAVELSVEYTPIEEAFTSPAGLSLDLARYRALAGARLGLDLATDVFLTLRLGLGVSHLRIDTDYRSSVPFPVEAHDTATDNGFTAEAGVGLWAQPGATTTMLGVELSLPLGWHPYETSSGMHEELETSERMLTLSLGWRI